MTHLKNVFGSKGILWHGTVLMSVIMNTDERKKNAFFLYKVILQSKLFFDNAMTFQALMPLTKYCLASLSVCLTVINRLDSSIHKLI